MKCYQFTCPPGTTFKAGSANGEDIDIIIHSDTLFSAVVNAYVLLYGQETVTEFIHEFAQYRIRISSVGYGLTTPDADEILFYPKPVLETSDASDLKQAKQAKKIRFVSTAVLHNLLNAFDTQHICSNYSLLKDTVTLGGGFAATTEELPNGLASSRFMHEVTDTKVQLDRRTGGAAEGMLYYESYVELTAFTDQNNGLYRPFLYFVADINSPYARQFDASVRLLCDEGIGGERAQGRGQFAGVAIKEFTPPVSSKLGWTYAFSLVHPASEEEFSSAQRYQLITRGGSPVRTGGTPNVPLSQQRKWVRMLMEGAIFANPVQGELVNIRTDTTSQSIYRNGINFGFQF